MGPPRERTARRAARLDRRRFARRFAIAGGVVVSALVGAAAVVAESAGAPSAGEVSTGRVAGGAATAPLLARQRAAARAQSLVVTKEMLPGGFRSDGRPPLPDLVRPSAPSPCTPVTAAPWLAAARSDRYVSRAGSSSDPAEVFSEVFVMPDAAVASSSWEAVAAPGYGPSCAGPALAAVAAQVVSASPPGPCQLAPSGSLSQPAPGGIPGPATAYRYQGSEACGAGPSRPVYLDAVSTAASACFIQVFFFSATEPPPATTEGKVLSGLRRRAGGTPAPAR